MPEAVKISSEDIKDWLQRETGSTLVPVQEEAQKLLDEMERELEEIIEVSKMLFEKSKEEIEKRSKKTYGRARALNKLARLFIKRMQHIEVPEEMSYDDFHAFIRQTRKAFVATEVDIKNWFPRISPYFILDRRKFEGVYDKAKDRLETLQNFLKEEYIKTKTLEETFQLIDSLLSQERQLADLKGRKKKTQTKKASIETKVAEMKQKMEDIKDQGGLTQIDQLDREIKKLRKKVRRKLRRLRKPFIKFQRVVFRKGGLQPKESKKLNQYIEEPFNSLATEEPGYPQLKEILRKIDSSITDGKLNLKSSRRRKAKEDIHNIIHKGSLDTLHKKCRRAATQKKRLSTSTKAEEARRNLRKLRKKLKKIKRRRKRVRLEKNRVEQEWKETLEKIHNHKNEIEKNITDFLGQKISIELKVQ